MRSRVFLRRCPICDSRWNTRWHKCSLRTQIRAVGKKEVDAILFKTRPSHFSPLHRLLRHRMGPGGSLQNLSEFASASQGCRTLRCDNSSELATEATDCVLDRCCPTEIAEEQDAC